MEQDKKVMEPRYAIIIPTGGTKKGEDGVFRSTTYDDGDVFGVLGGYARVEAAAILAKKFPQAAVVTTGKGAGDGVAPSHAEVMKRELVELGVHPEQIILEENSTSTRSNIAEAFSLARKHGWNSLVVITNEYHVPRVRLMVEMANSGISTECVSAEEIIIRERPSFKEEFEGIKSRPSYQKRMESESRGIETLQTGKYHEAPVEDKKERLV